MKWFRFVPALAVVFLAGCLSHWVVDTSTRLQLENRTSFQAANLRLVAESGQLPPVEWIPDTLEPNKRSHVFEEDYVGSFHFRISVKDLSCGDSLCWQDHSLGLRSLGGGSVLWRLEIEDGQLKIQAK